MGRYSTQAIKRRGDGKRVFTSTAYPRIGKKMSDIYVIATDADRLDILSFQFYGRTDYWWIIAIANNIGRGTLTVPEGAQLRIPTDVEDVIKEYNRINNVV